MIRDFCVDGEDLAIYEREFANRIPEKIIDAHVHLWGRDCLKIPTSSYAVYKQYKPWTDFDMMEEFTLNDFERCASEAFPGREYQGVFFGLPFPQADRGRSNDRVMRMSVEAGKGFYYMPGQFEDAWETDGTLGLTRKTGFLGFKPYPDLVEKKEGEISIYDMLNRSFLEFAEKHELYVMLHIPGKNRLHDGRIRKELEEITDTYRHVIFVMAHVGRSFCYPDVEGSIDFLTGKENVLFDTALINDPLVLEYLFRRVPPEKILFGSDAPLAFVRGKDVCVNNRHYYVSEKMVPWGLGPGRENFLKLTFYLYEEIRAILYASRVVYGKSEEKALEKIFFANMQGILRRKGLEEV